MRYLVWSSLMLLFIFSISCSSGKSSSVDMEDVADEVKTERKRRFSGNYNREFNDLQDLHMDAAQSNGVGPLVSRDDTLKFKKKILRLPDELDLYRTYDLTHSIPFLVPSATQLFVDIAQNFRDSLYSKDIPLHRLYLTSVLRTDDDVAKLTKRNSNASENSVHRYGTTFDISWKRFDPLVTDTANQISPDRLKLVLAQVIYDLKNQDRCYVMHERRQACFHITVR